MTRSLSPLLALALAGGCVFGSDDSDSKSHDTTPDAGVSSSPHAPRILTLDTNSPTIDEYDRLLITAVVTDPQGIDDLIGGTLVDPMTGGSYGAFATAAAEGAYSISLTWTEIDQVRTLDAPSTGGSRSFRARFFDVAGNSTEAELTVTLKCMTSGLTACGGLCVDLMTSDAHCGACNTAVPENTECEGGRAGCVQGAESTVAACSDSCSNDGDSYVDCNDYNCCDVVSCPTGTTCGNL